MVYQIFRTTYWNKWVPIHCLHFVISILTYIKELKYSVGLGILDFSCIILKISCLHVDLPQSKLYIFNLSFN